MVAGLDVSRGQVQRAMRQVLGSSSAGLSSWELDQLPYLSILPGRALARLTGWAAPAAGRNARWSTVIKVIAPPKTASTVTDSGQREVLANRSGLRTELPGRFRAPRVYRIDHSEDGGTWLWLEDLHDIHGRRWHLEQFCRARVRHIRLAVAHLFGHRGLVDVGTPWRTWRSPGRASCCHSG